MIKSAFCELKIFVGFGDAKLTLKSKTANGINLKAEQSRKFSDGSVSGLLEVKYTNAAQGSMIASVLSSIYF
jgi:hypothetical protein